MPKLPGLRRICDAGECYRTALLHFELDRPIQWPPITGEYSRTNFAVCSDDHREAVAQMIMPYNRGLRIHAK